MQRIIVRRRVRESCYVGKPRSGRRVCCDAERGNEGNIATSPARGEIVQPGARGSEPERASPPPRVTFWLIRRPSSLRCVPSARDRGRNNPRHAPVRFGLGTPPGKHKAAHSADDIVSLPFPGAAARPVCARLALPRAIPFRHVAAAPVRASTRRRYLLSRLSISNRLVVAP